MLKLILKIYNLYDKKDKKIKHKIKIGMLGDQGVGKTTLLTSFFENSSENINSQSKIKNK